MDKSSGMKFGELDTTMVGHHGGRSLQSVLTESFYGSEPCRICGEIIGDIDNAVFAGYSDDSVSRSAHKKCWDKKLNRKYWAFPTDDR